MKLEEFRERSLALEERRVAAAEKLAAAVQTIAWAVEDEEGWIIKAILTHATVNAQDVAGALNNVAGAITHSVVKPRK
jgi:hypothetical protein